MRRRRRADAEVVHRDVRLLRRSTVPDEGASEPAGWSVEVAIHHGVVMLAEPREAAVAPAEGRVLRGPDRGKLPRRFIAGRNDPYSRLSASLSIGMPSSMSAFWPPVRWPKIHRVSGYFRSSWCSHCWKPLFSMSPEGPVLVRGARLDGSGDVRFGSGDTPTDDLQLPIRSDEHTPGQPAGWRMFNQYLRLSKPGGYALQIDTLSSSQIVVVDVAP